MRHTLYHLESCPFCIRVRSAAQALGIELELVDIASDRAAYDRIRAARGRGTVPVLGIPTPTGERLMGESADIVAYLQQHASQLRA